MMHSDNFGERLKSHYIKHITDIRTQAQASFKTKYLSSIYHGNFEGISELEILEIQRAQSVPKLPTPYSDFLLSMGRSSGGIFIGCAVHFDDLLQIKSQLENMMSENRQGLLDIPFLPDNAFIFMSIQDVDFFFFIANEIEDDPPIYYYADGSKQFIKVCETVSQWFFEQAFDPLSYVKRS